MAFLITVLVVLAFVWLVGGITGAMVLGASPLVMLGLKEGVFVSKSKLLYHKTQNFLPTFPLLCSEFSDLHESPIPYEEALKMVPEADAVKHKNRYSWR
jgi:hypothetical protein